MVHEAFFHHHAAVCQCVCEHLIDLICGWMHRDCDIRAELFVKQGSIRLHSLFDIDSSRQGLIINIDQIDSIACNVFVLGYHNSDRIAKEANLAIGQWSAAAHTTRDMWRKRSRDWNIADTAFEVLGRVYGDHARQVARGLRIDAIYAGMTIGAA